MTTLIFEVLGLDELVGEVCRCCPAKSPEQQVCTRFSQLMQLTKKLRHWLELRRRKHWSGTEFATRHWKVSWPIMAHRVHGGTTRRMVQWPVALDINSVQPCSGIKQGWSSTSCIEFRWRRRLGHGPAIWAPKWWRIVYVLCKNYSFARHRFWL